MGGRREVTVTITFALAVALANVVHLMTQHAASAGVSNTIVAGGSSPS